ncbi:MAG: tryptophan-rich sensory protein [Caldilineaceae bacterium]
MSKYLVRQILVVVAVVGTITVNVLANALPINGMTTGDISDSFDVLFVPAGYVFSIWGLIYLGLAAYAVYQALPSQRDNERLRSIDYPFLLSSIANIAWIFLWHYERFPLTIAAMLVLLVSLIIIYLRLDIGRGYVRAVERWLVDVPFSIYLGWITVATIANITTVLDFVSWNGWGLSDEAWFVIMLAVAILVAVLMTIVRADVAYLLVLAWAFAGIGVKHADNSLVVTTSWIATVIVLGLVVFSIVRRWKTTKAVPVAV